MFKRMTLSVEVSYISLQLTVSLKSFKTLATTNARLLLLHLSIDLMILPILTTEYVNQLVFVR